jgi:methyl-accepting chemotaxis protein
MKFDLVSFIVSVYDSGSLQIRLKSRILAWSAMVMGSLSILMGTVMFVTGAVVVGVLLAAFFVFALTVALILRAGKYFAASSIFLYGLFAVMFLAIKFDAYKNVYECYVFGTLGSFLLITGALIANKSRQTTILAFLDLAAIAVLYALDGRGADGGKVTLLAIQSLVTSGIMVALGGVFASMIVKTQNNLLSDVERQAKQAGENYRSMSEAITETQDNALRIGGALAERADGTIEALKELRVAIHAILEGMDGLTAAVAESETANARAVTGQEVVQEALADYSGEVSKASAAIEEMAASVKSIGAQASGKREAVRGLCDLAEAGEAKLSRIKDSIDQILVAAGSMMEMSGFIEDVAERTNLLGLNASIEAAHAGAAGRGFAVVAGQIRNLSIEAGKSSRVISQTLKETRAGIEAASGQNAEAIEFFKTISQEIRGVSGMIEELLSSLQEMSNGAVDVVQAVEAVSSFTVSTEKAVNDSRQSIAVSSTGITKVAAIAGEVRVGSIEMDARFGRMEEDAVDVQRLGGENLVNVETLRMRIDAVRAAAEKSG